MDLARTVVPPVQVRTSGHVHDWPHHSTPGTRQGDWMLTVFTGGRGTYRAAHTVHEVREGVVGLVPPEDPGILFADRRAPYAHYYCRFNGAYAVALAASILAFRGRRFFAPACFPRLVELMRRMPQWHAADLPLFLGPREHLLVQVLTTLAGGEPPVAATALTRDALQGFLLDSLGQRLNLDKVAARFHVSRSRLCRFARSAFGATLARVQEDLRMEQARELLGLRLPVKEVAARVGYADPCYFSRVFARREGVPPTTWARSRESRAEPRTAPRGVRDSRAEPRAAPRGARVPVNGTTPGAARRVPARAARP